MWVEVCFCRGQNWWRGCGVRKPTLRCHCHRPPPNGWCEYADEAAIYYDLTTFKRCHFADGSCRGKHQHKMAQHQYCRSLDRCNARLTLTQWRPSVASHVCLLFRIADCSWPERLTRTAALLTRPTWHSRLDCAAPQLLHRRHTASSSQVAQRHRHTLRPPTLGVKSPSLAVSSDLKPMGVAEYAV